MRLGMMRVGFPGRPVGLSRLIPPLHPAGPDASGEHLQIRAVRAGFDDGIYFVRLAAVLPFSRRNEIDLPPARLARPGVLASNSKQDQFGDIAEIESYTPPVASAVLTNFVPDDVGFVCEAPRLQHG